MASTISRSDSYGLFFGRGVGYLKDKVYNTKPQALDDLQNRIKIEIAEILDETLGNSGNSFHHRLACCQEVGGYQFEHLL